MSFSLSLGSFAVAIRRPVPSSNNSLQKLCDNDAPHRDHDSLPPADSTMTYERSTTEKTECASKESFGQGSGGLWDQPDGYDGQSDSGVGSRSIASSRCTRCSTPQTFRLSSSTSSSITRCSTVWLGRLGPGAGRSFIPGTFAVARPNTLRLEALKAGSTTIWTLSSHTEIQLPRGGQWHVVYTPSRVSHSPRATLLTVLLGKRGLTSSLHPSPPSGTG